MLVLALLPLPTLLVVLMVFVAARPGRSPRGRGRVLAYEGGTQSFRCIGSERAERGCHGTMDAVVPCCQIHFPVVTMPRGRGGGVGHGVG